MALHVVFMVFHLSLSPSHGITGCSAATAVFYNKIGKSSTQKVFKSLLQFYVQSSWRVTKGNKTSKGFKADPSHIESISIHNDFLILSNTPKYREIIYDIGYNENLTFCVPPYTPKFDYNNNCASLLQITLRIVVVVT